MATLHSSNRESGINNGGKRNGGRRKKEWAGGKNAVFVLTSLCQGHPRCVEQA